MWKSLGNWVCIAVLLPLAARGETAKIEVLPGDSPVRIRGKIGDDTTFVKQLGLMAPVAVPELILRSRDLTSNNGLKQISRQQVALTSTAKLDLAQNTPEDVEIKVTGVKLPGTYKGEISFLQPGQGLSAALKVPIEVIAEGVPKLAPRKGSETVKLQLFDCVWLGCRVAEWLQPGAFLPRYPLVFNNSSLEDFQMTAVLNATGDAMHESLESVLTIQSPMKVSSGPIYTLPVAIHKTRILPDHYSGDVQLRVGTDSLLSIPVDVNVRTGPILPILVLFIGVLLGRLLKYMKDKGGPQSDLLLHLYQFESQISGYPQDQQLLQPMLEGIKTLIYQLELDAAKDQMKAVENRWALLSKLRRLEQILEPHASDASVKTILDKIGNARELISLEDDVGASTLVTDIEQAVRNWEASTPRAAASKLASKQARATEIVATRNARNVTAPPKIPIHVRLLRALTGIYGPFRAEVTLLVIRPLLFLLLVAALLVLGLQQLYLKNPVFGLDPLTDYFGILIWAMSSDIASRTLAGFKAGL
ncbi:MAG TPA: hypothetical protein VHC97_23560 [Thermoanaerobaculia bacterium]|nr:hypothetical protein [Thermoanaerobaculia bacterium]